MAQKTWIFVLKPEIDVKIPNSSASIHYTIEYANDLSCMEGWPIRKISVLRRLNLIEALANKTLLVTSKLVFLLQRSKYKIVQLQYSKQFNTLMT